MSPTQLIITSPKMAAAGSPSSQSKPQLDPISSATTSCSSHGGSTTSPTWTSSTITSSHSNFECSSYTPDHHQPHLSPLSSSTTLCHEVESKLSAPLKRDQLFDAAESELLSPSPGRSSRNAVKSANSPNKNASVKKSMGLRKLRKQGSAGLHAPASTVGASGGRLSSSSSCINQAAAARELMASLERLSISGSTEKAMAMRRPGISGRGEADQSSLLEYIESGEENRVSRPGPGLRLCAKIAAAMDAEGRIGVQKEIECTLEAFHMNMKKDQINNTQQQPMMMMMNTYNTTSPAAAPATYTTTTCCKTINKKRRMQTGRWIMRPKLRSTRALLGRIWRNIRRVFSSSSKRRLKKERLSISTN